MFRLILRVLNSFSYFQENLGNFYFLRIIFALPELFSNVLIIP